MFPITPDVLHRIEFRCIGGQIVGDQPTILGSDERLRQARLMSRQAIPQHQQFARHMAQQVREKVHHLWSPDSTRIKPEVEVAPGNSSRSRKQFPIKVILQHRGLSPRRPGTYPVGPLAQSAFIDEDDGPLLTQGFFLSCGQRLRFQCRIASSSRSRARPAGRWQLQFSLRRIRHTCEGLYRTPYCCSMSLHTRAKVQSPVKYPNCSGPCCKYCSSCTKSAALNFGSRPARAAWRSPLCPAAASALAQRLTDW